MVFLYRSNFCSNFVFNCVPIAVCTLRGFCRFSLTYLLPRRPSPLTTVPIFFLNIIFSIMQHRCGHMIAIELRFTFDTKWLIVSHNLIEVLPPDFITKTWNSTLNFIIFQCFTMLKHSCQLLVNIPVSNNHLSSDFAKVNLKMTNWLTFHLENGIHHCTMFRSTSSTWKVIFVFLEKSVLRLFYQRRSIALIRQVVKKEKQSQTESCRIQQPTEQRKKSFQNGFSNQTAFLNWTMTLRLLFV